MSFQELNTLQYLEDFATCAEPLCPLCEHGEHDYPVNTSALFKCGCPCHGSEQTL